MQNKFYVLIFFCFVCIILFAQDSIAGLTNLTKNHRHTDNSFHEMNKWLIESAMLRVSCQNKQDFGINITQYNCFTKTGTISVTTLEGGSKFEYQIEVKNGQPVALVYNSSDGIKTVVWYDNVKKSFPRMMIENQDGDSFVFDFTKQKFVDAKISKIQELKKYDTPTLLQILNEYYQLGKRINEFTQSNWVTTKFVYSILNSEVERKQLVRYADVVRKYYDISKINDRYLPWFFDFAIYDFIDYGLPYDTKIQILGIFNNVPFFITRDITEKIETIQVDKAKIKIKFDETGVHVLDSNYENIAKIQKDIEKFNNRDSLQGQLIEHMKQYTKR